QSGDGPNPASENHLRPLGHPPNDCHVSLDGKPRLNRGAGTSGTAATAGRRAQKKPQSSCGWDSCGQKAPVGVEPTMADLQSAALATWLRRPELNLLVESYLGLSFRSRGTDRARGGKSRRVTLRFCFALATHFLP